LYDNDLMSSQWNSNSITIKVYSSILWFKKIKKINKTKFDELYYNSNEKIYLVLKTCSGQLSKLLLTDNLFTNSRAYCKDKKI